MTQERYGRYRIIKPLGEGGMASVHLAEDPVLRRVVAVKVLRGELGTQADWVRRFHDEATSIARLGSPHVVAVHDFGRESGEDYLVMEFVEGISLSGLLQRRAGRLDPVAAAAAACQVAEGLRAAHEMGIVHRDIKPDNVLVRRDGTAKVADFGIARLLEEVSRTMTGSVFGSPLFMAPEQIEGRNPSGAIDVFALAGVLFLCLTGRHPFEAEHAHAVMWRIVQEEAPSLRSAMPDAPPELDELVASMHGKNPSARPRAGEVVRLLRQFLASRGVHDPVEALRAALPESVLQAEPVSLGRRQEPPPAPPRAPAARERRRTFLQEHPRLVPLCISGASLILAAYLAGKAWDRLHQDAIPAASIPKPAEVLPKDSTAAATPTEEARARSHRPSQPAPRTAAPPPPPAAPAPPPDRGGPPAPGPGPRETPSGGVQVSMRDEAPSDQGAVRPRIAIANRGGSRLDWVQVSWPLPVPPGPAPVLDVYYAPKCSIHLDGAGRDTRLVVECANLALSPGQVWPGPDGMSLSIHHADWSPWKGKAATGLGPRMEIRPEAQVRAR